MNTIIRLIKEEDGQATAEYALLVTVVSLATMTIFLNLSEAIAADINLAAQSLK